MRVLLCLLAMAAPFAARADIATRAAPVAVFHEARPDALDAIAHAHLLRCGVITAAEDYSDASTHGDLSAFGADLCRATAAALLGDAKALRLVAFPEDAHGLRALRAGGIDLLFGVTPDAANALQYGVAFGPTLFFDTQGVMVNRHSGIARLNQLRGHTLCFITGTSQETRMENWRAATGASFLPHDFQERGEMDAALVTGSCAAVTDDVSALAQVRAGFHAQAADFVILPEPIAIDPWAPAMRAGEVRLNAALTDIVSALITGEALGITQATATAPHPGAPMLLGATPGIAKTLGMPDGWARRAIGSVGNYSEIFERRLGARSLYRLDRGHDALWSAGGMLGAPTLR